MGDWIWILIPLTALLIPITAIWTAHQRELIKLRIQHGQTGDSALIKELQDLKAQIAEVRDTTTRYDMSFDSALQRIESRVGNLEGKVHAIEQGTNVASR